MSVLSSFIMHCNTELVEKVSLTKPNGVTGKSAAEVYEEKYTSVRSWLKQQELVPVGTVYRGGDNPDRMSWTTDPLVAINFALSDGVVYKIDNAMGYVVDYNEDGEEYMYSSESEVLVLDTSNAEVLVENKYAWPMSAFKLIMEHSSTRGAGDKLREAFHRGEYLEMIYIALDWLADDDASDEYMEGLKNLLAEEQYGYQEFTYEESSLKDDLFCIADAVIAHTEEYL